MTYLCLRLARHYVEQRDWPSALAELYKAMAYNQSRHGGEHSDHIRRQVFASINVVRKLQREA